MRMLAQQRGDLAPARRSGRAGAPARGCSRASRRPAATSVAARCRRAGSLTRSTASCVAATTCSMSSLEDRAGRHHEPVGDRRRGGRAAVDRAVDQHLLGAELEHRLAHRAHVRGGARAGDFDRARLCEPARSRLRRAACSRPSARAARARRRSPAAARRCVATRLPACRCTRGLSMRASITSCASPSRPIEVTPTGAPGAARARRGSPRASRSCRCSSRARPARARACRRAARQPRGAVSAIRAGCARGAGRPDARVAMRAASSRTMKLATWCG